MTADRLRLRLRTLMLFTCLSTIRGQFTGLRLSPFPDTSTHRLQGSLSVSASAIVLGLVTASRFAHGRLGAGDFAAGVSVRAIVLFSTIGQPTSHAARL